MTYILNMRNGFGGPEAYTEIERYVAVGLSVASINTDDYTPEYMNIAARFCVDQAMKIMVMEG